MDNVYLTPGTELAVMERGGVWRQLSGQRERCFILGVGVLEGMKMAPFKAILAHEYGHFSNRDTAGGGFALAVRRSLDTMAAHLARSGAARWYNPAWLFVIGYYRVFLRISQGASRLQEVLADRWAAFGTRPQRSRSRRVARRRGRRLDPLPQPRRDRAPAHPRDPEQRPRQHRHHHPRSPAGVGARGLIRRLSRARHLVAQLGPSRPTWR